MNKNLQWIVTRNCTRNRGQKLRCTSYPADLTTLRQAPDILHQRQGCGENRWMCSTVIKECKHHFGTLSTFASKVWDEIQNGTNQSYWLETQITDGHGRDMRIFCHREREHLVAYQQQSEFVSRKNVSPVKEKQSEEHDDKSQVHATRFFSHLAYSSKFQGVRSVVCFAKVAYI